MPDADVDVRGDDTQVAVIPYPCTRASFLLRYRHHVEQAHLRMAGTSPERAQELADNSMIWLMQVLERTLPKHAPDPGVGSVNDVILSAARDVALPLRSELSRTPMHVQAIMELRKLPGWVAYDDIRRLP